MNEATYSEAVTAILDSVIEGGVSRDEARKALLALSGPVTLRWAVISRSNDGCTWYLSKEPGRITRHSGKVWTTPDRFAAEFVASGAEGRSVVLL